MRRIKRRGFSLIEVLFGIFLISACAAILAATVPVASSSRITADYSNKATSIAHTEMERIRGAGYAQLTPDLLSQAGLISSKSPNEDGSYPFATGDGIPSGTGSVAVQQVDIDLRQVTVTVTYQVRGVTKTRTVGGLVANL